MLPTLSSTSRAMKIGLSSKTLDQMQLSELVRWTIRPRLMAVPGVANVAVWGQRDRQLQVLVDPTGCNASGVTLAELRARQGDAVLVGGGGFVDTPNQRLASAGRRDPDRRGPGAVRRQDRRRRRRCWSATWPNVSRALPRRSAMPSSTTARACMLIVEKQPDGNTLAVTRGVEAAIAELRPGLKRSEGRHDDLPPGDVHRALDRQPDARRWRSAACWLRWCCSPFTRDWRQALISLTAIPLSLLAPGLVLALERRDDQHDGDRRAGHRARRDRR
jgi:multidrug efflux pump subunit AcrB